MQVEPIVRTTASSSARTGAITKEIAEEEASLRSEEVALKTLQDQMARLTERLESHQISGEQARIQEQGLSSLISRPVSKLKS